MSLLTGSTTGQAGWLKSGGQEIPVMAMTTSLFLNRKVGLVIMKMGLKQYFDLRK